MQAFKAVALTAVAGEMLLAGHAQAAQEVASMAGDNRAGLLLTLLLPVIGWVGYNILGPAKNQLDSMSNRSVAIGAGFGLAALLTAGRADATQEVASLAGDNRVAILLTLFLPVVGWVLFNIAGPALNQIDRMGDKKKGIVGAGVGISAASLLTPGQADAAQEIAALAGDNRLGILLTLLVPVVGWVLFNILGPAKNQLDNMSKKGAVVGLGLGASALYTGQADAAQEIAAVAGDGRLGILLTLFVPVAGWVLFNILEPAKNQLDSMQQ